MTQQIFRFAPSPTGQMHLGNAYSALLNEKMAGELGGKLLLRIEDIDHTRCRQEYIDSLISDMDWLGIKFEPEPRAQSQHIDFYKKILSSLTSRNLTYRCRCTRRELMRDGSVRKDPEGQPLYSGICRHSPPPPHVNVAWRLDMAKAISVVGNPIYMRESGQTLQIDPAAWGDVVLARKDLGTSYHLSVVADDALQGVTDIVRGEELLGVTAIHRLLQELLGYPAPRYHHHQHIKTADGRKLSKSAGDTTLRDLRAQGMTAPEVRAMLGF